MAKTAEQYAAELGAVQKQYQFAKAQGQSTAAFEAQGQAIRSQATQGGADLSKLGATNKYGQDYTSFVNPVNTGIVATDTTPTTAPSNDISTSYINNWNTAKQQATFAQLEKSKNAALSGLQNERSAITPKFHDQRNQVAAGSQQSYRNLNEFMAARGNTRSGSAAQAEISRQGTLQGNLGSLGRQETQAYTDIERRTSDLNSAYEQDRLSAVSGIEADRMSSLLGQYNTDRNYNLQQQGQNFNQGMANKQFGLQEKGQQYDQANQDWNNRFNYGQATGTFANGQQTLENQKVQYTQGRDVEADRKWEAEFERIKKQDGVANALNWAQNSISQQNANTSATSTANSNANQIADRAQRETEFKYTQEQDLLSNRTKPPEELTDKASTDNYNVIMDDLASGATKEEGRSLLQQNSANLTDADYKKINDWINGNL